MIDFVKCSGLYINPFRICYAYKSGDHYYVNLGGDENIKITVEEAEKLGLGDKSTEKMKKGVKKHAVKEENV